MADDDLAFRQQVGQDFTPAERLAMSEQTDDMLVREFSAFTEQERGLLWAAQDAGYSTSGPEWAAIAAHPNAKALAGFLMKTPAFQRSIHRDEDDD